MLKNYQLFTFIFITLFLFSIGIASCGKKSSSQQLSYEEWQNLKQEGNDSIFHNPTHTRNIIKKAYTMTDDPAILAEIDQLQANICFYSSQPDSAVIFLNRIQKYCESVKLTPATYTLLGTTSGIWGHIYAWQNKPDSALIYYQKAYDYILKSDQKRLLPALCIQLADAYNFKGEYALCAHYYRKALHQIDSLNLSATALPSIYSGLGGVYLELKNFDLSDYYYELAGQHFDEMDIMDKSFYLNNRGNYYYYKKDYNKAFEYFSQLKDLVFDDPDNLHYQNICALNLAQVFLLKEEIDSTRHYLTFCEPYFIRTNNATALYYIETLRLGVAIQEKNRSEVEKLIRQSETPAFVVPNMLSVRQSYLKDYYEETNNYKEAYRILTEEKLLEDSLRNETVKKNVAEIEFRYQQDTALINRNHLLHQKENETKTLKYSLISILSICLLLIGGILLTIMYSRKQQEYLRMKNRSQIVDLKMENIRNRIFPHFIFNNLNRILHSPDEAEARFTHLGEMIMLLRKNLELVEKHIISLQEELDFVEKYIRVEKYSLGKEFRYTLYMDPSIPVDSIYIPSMTIQILVENAIKHGLKLKEGKKELNITVTEQNKYIHISIADNGPGFSRQATLSDDSTGTGLKVIRQTIHLYNTLNSDKIDLQIKNREEDGVITGCVVEIVLPKKMNYLQYQ